MKKCPICNGWVGTGSCCHDEAVISAIEIANAESWDGDAKEVMTRIIGAARVLANAILLNHSENQRQGKLIHKQQEEIEKWIESTGRQYPPCLDSEISTP